MRQSALCEDQQNEPWHARIWGRAPMHNATVPSVNSNNTESDPRIRGDGLWIGQGALGKDQQ